MRSVPLEPGTSAAPIAHGQLRPSQQLFCCTTGAGPSSSHGRSAPTSCLPGSRHWQAAAARPASDGRFLATAASLRLACCGAPPAACATRPSLLQRKPRWCGSSSSKAPPGTAARAGAVGAADQPAAGGSGGSSAAAGEQMQRVPAISRSLWQRIVSSTVLGLLGAVAIVSGGWPFCVAACLVAYQSSQEFFGFVTSKGISEGMPPPPPLLCAVISATCISFIVWMQLTNGAGTAMLAVTSFIVLSLQLLVVETPRFSQLTSSVFGLFYCGYLPSFWVKLRLLSAPAANSQLLQLWPACLGGLLHCTVGLVASLTAVLCIVAADTGAFFFGKTFGRTQLIPISPKKTVEGAVGGLLCSNLMALAMWRAFHWPTCPTHAVCLASVVFVASLFGDLIESVMKREAGLKDAGNLIPGHGGLLDRFDSYLFTGAIVYFYVKYMMPMWGV